MFSVSENNWLGRGIGFGASLDLTEDTISGSISVDNPNYKYSGNSVFTSLDVSAADKTLSSGYESSSTGFSLGTEFAKYENVFLSPNISATHERVEVQSSASSAMKKMDGTFNNLDFSYGITAVSYTHLTLPTKSSV